MTLHFKEANKYLIDYGVASSIILVCTYVEDNTVWFETLHKDALYKYDKKKDKLYVFNTRVQAYDLVEGCLSECSHCADGEVTKACYDGVWRTSPCEQCS